MYVLGGLQFSAEALEPFIDALTMTIHHDKHHATYVDNLNKALEAYPSLLTGEVWNLLSNLDSVPQEVRTKVQNNGGGHANHTFFWKLLCPPKESGEPTSGVLGLIEKNFGSFDEFQAKFKEASLGRFGSGWAWVVLVDKESLEITSTPNQDTPWMEKRDAILGLDLWEHAYYLKYQNKRADYIDAFWNVVNWAQVEENLQKAISYASSS